MTNDMAIEIKGLSKVYRLYDRPVDRLKEALLPFHKRYSRDFYALRDINLSIKKGETVGFIGQNGAGKSTLLKVITGVLTPTCGTMEVRGRIASLLELGAGFNPEMTGVENIYMNGVVMGLSREEMDARVDDIIAFADVGDFINQPVKTYSSGMFARVAFAVNAFVEPDILIVDEALSVGDSFFQAKCMHKMKSLLDSGVTVLFVSHDWGAVKNLCQRAVLLNKGQIVLDGTADEAVEKYRAIQLEDRVQSGEAHLHIDTTGIPVLSQSRMSAADKKWWFEHNEAFLKAAEYQRFQNGKVEFNNVVLLDEEQNEINSLTYGQKVTLRMALTTNAPVEICGAGYHLRNSEGIDIAYTDSHYENNAGVIVNAKAGERFLIDWTFEAFFARGRYNIAAVISIPLRLDVCEVECCDFVPCALQFEVANDWDMGGYVRLPSKVIAYRA